MRRFLTFVFLGLLLLAGCKKDGVRHLVCKTGTWHTGGKTYINSNAAACWANGDAIMINGEQAQLSVSTGTSTYVQIPIPSNQQSCTTFYAFYPASMVSSYTTTANGTPRYTLNLPVIQKYETDNGGNQIVRAPMAARCTVSSGNGTLQFVNLCSIICVQLPGDTHTHVREIAVGTVGTSTLYGTAHADYPDGESNINFSVNEVLSGAYNSIMLVGENMQRSDGKYYVVLPPTAADTGYKYEIAVKYEVGGTVYYKSFKQTAGGNILHNGDIATDSVSSEDLTSGRTTISVNGKLATSRSLRTYAISFNGTPETIYFSEGNLQYRPTGNGEWRFSPFQFLSAETDHQGISQTTWIDLFGFGTSGRNNGNTYYRPADNYHYITANSNRGYGYGPINSTNSTSDISLTGDYANADWGVANRSSLKGGTSTNWRTLTSEEWRLLLSRAPNEGCTTPTWGYAVVCGVNGIVLYPNRTKNLTSCPQSANSGSWSSKTLSPTSWMLMESYGAVFLPATGYRGDSFPNDNDSSVLTLTNVRNGAYYWSTTSSDAGNANCIQFTLGTPAITSTPKYNGLSVRLVQVQTP